MSVEQTIALDFTPRPWQQACYEQLKRFNVLVVHRRGGKTILAIMLLISRALRCQREAPRFAYVAPEKAQAKRVAWDYLKRYAAAIPGTKISEVELWVEFKNGARIQIDGADEPDRMRGIYLDGVVLDELADMKPTTWGEVVRPALTDRQGWALFIGTPKGLNLLSELFYAAAGKPDWFAARYTIDDTHAVDAAEVEAARRDMSAAQFAQEFMCDFAAGNEEAFIEARVIDEASAREAVDPLSMGAEPLVMGVDVARFGGDECVVWFRRGRDARSLPPQFYRLSLTEDTMWFASKIVELAVTHRPDAVFIDEGGVGGPVIDRIRQLGIECQGVNNGSKPSGGTELVANKGAECWCRMRAWLKDGGAIPKDTELRQQLGARKYKYDAHNAIVLESKPDMKKRGLSSPDRADALALTFAYPVAPRPTEYDADMHAMVRAAEGGQREYDMFRSLR